MSLRQALLDKGKQALLRPSVMRWVSDDRVMKATEGLLDARGRLMAAWNVLLNGHALPNVDPALDESIGKSAPAARDNGQANGASNGARADMSSGSSDMDESMKERTTLANIGGKDVFEKAYKFMAADNARKMGIYPFFRPLDLQRWAGSRDQRQARVDVRLEQLPGADQAPQGARGCARRHRALRHQHDRLTAGQWLDEDARGAGREVCRLHG
jgi:hypothetical protein